MRMLNGIQKVIPIITLVSGALFGALGLWYGMAKDMNDVKRTVEQVVQQLELHRTSWNHDNWFDPDWVRHPALRGALERRERVLIERLEQTRKAEKEECWKRVKELNPTFITPNW